MMMMSARKSQKAATGRLQKGLLERRTWWGEERKLIQSRKMTRQENWFRSHFEIYSEMTKSSNTSGGGTYKSSAEYCYSKVKWLYVAKFVIYEFGCCSSYWSTVK
jgi:hypothetical protein